MPAQLNAGTKNLGSTGADATSSAIAGNMYPATSHNTTHPKSHGTTVLLLSEMTNDLIILIAHHSPDNSGYSGSNSSVDTPCASRCFSSATATATACFASTNC